MFKITALKSLFKKEKKVSIPNHARVQLLSDKANNLVNSFRQTHDDLDEINNELIQLIEEENQKAAEAKKNRDRANEEVVMNQKLQGKLAEFIR